MKVVKILWEDSCNSNLNWVTKEDVEVELINIDSFGVVVKETDEFVSIAQNYGSELEQVSNIVTIPRGCIKEIFVIHDDNYVRQCKQKSTKEKLQALSDGEQHLGWLDDADKVIEEEQKPVEKTAVYPPTLDKAIDLYYFSYGNGKGGFDLSLEKFKDIVKTFVDDYGGQKPVFEMKTPEESLGVDSDTYNKIVDECIYGEQKPAGKVEPKFHEGDFILNGDVTDDGKPEIFRVLKVCDTWYDVENIYDSRHTIITFKQECSCRVWNYIQDAKDGDVLAAEPIKEYHYPFVAIYKKQNEEDFASYCFIGFDGKFYKGENNHSTEEVHPATKEQREQLEKAMADAGYTFDFERKELKKVEQKPQRMISAEAKEALYDKPAWSEEDEVHLKAAIECTFRCGHLSTTNWLKSLRPQKRWKPSELQIEALESATENCAYSEYQDCLRELIEQLKK